MTPGPPANLGAHRLEPGMTTGIVAGLGAGAFWGLAFVAPLMAPSFSAIDITWGRYLACALVSVLLMLWSAARGQLAWPTPRQAIAALGLSVLGYTGYYLLLALAIQTAGATLPVLVIGTIPLWLMLLGKPQAMRWRSLAWGLSLTAAGVALMAYATTHGASGVQQGPRPGWGVAYAALATASWVLFGLLNKRWLAHHPEVNDTLWASWMGVAAGGGAFVVWWWGGSPWHALVARPGFSTYVLVCAITGVGAAWVASVLWNMASRRLSASLAGQLIVSETVFGLLFAFVWTAHWPTAVQWVACVLFLMGVLASIQAHR